MLAFVITSIITLLLLRMHNPIGLGLIPPWFLITIKLARSGQ